MIVALPDDEDSDVRRWIEETCDLTITSPRRRWSIVYPPAIDIDSLGHLSVASTRNLLLATFTPQGQDEEQGSFSASASRSSASTATAHGTQFFAVQHDGKSDTPVALSWDGVSLPEITQVAQHNPLALAGVSFTFRSRSGAERYRSFLHQRQIGPLFQAVRRSELDISAISPPAGCEGAFKWRKALGMDWQSITLSIGRDGTRHETDEEAVNQVNLLLQDASLNACFDFGGLGSLYLEASRRQAVHARQKCIPSIVRQRIIWFCITAKSYPRGSLKPLTAIADDALLRHFRTVVTPSFLIAHRRQLDAQIKAFSKSSGTA